MKLQSSVTEQVTKERDTQPGTVTDLQEYKIQRLLNSSASVTVRCMRKSRGRMRHKTETMGCKVLIKDLFPATTASVQDGNGRRLVPTGAIVLIRRKNGSYECLA